MFDLGVCYYVFSFAVYNLLGVLLNDRLSVRAEFTHFRVELEFILNIRIVSNFPNRKSGVGIIQAENIARRNRFSAFAYFSEISVGCRKIVFACRAFCKLVTDFVNIIVIFDRGCYKHSRFIVTEETFCLATFELPFCSRGFMYTPNAQHNTGNRRKNEQYAENSFPLIC